MTPDELDPMPGNLKRHVVNHGIDFIRGHFAHCPHCDAIILPPYSHCSTCGEQTLPPDRPPLSPAEIHNIKLKRRIKELELENASLREVLAQVDAVKREPSGE